MPIAAGRWVSGFGNELVGQYPHPSPFYFPILTILADDPPREDVTHFSLASRSLCSLTGFFETAFSFQPCLDGYFQDFHRYNDWAAKAMRYAYWPILVYASNFNSSFVEVLDHYPIKLVFFQAKRATPEILKAISTFRSPAIVVVEDRSTRTLAESHGVHPLEVGSELSTHLQRAIEELARTPPAEYRKKGFTDAEIDPIILVDSRPREFSFSESCLNALPYPTMRLVRPNGILGNVLRRKYPHEFPPQPPIKNRLGVLLNSILVVFGERLVDHLVIEARDAPDPTLDARLEKPLSAYIADNSSKNYEALLAEAVRHLPTYPGACDFILCCPSINPRYPLESLGGRVPTRVLRMVLRKTAEDYLDYIRPQSDFRSEHEFKLYVALMSELATENEYLSNVLSLHALASRRPVLRIPKLPSSLYGKLRALRRGYQHSRPKAFLKQLKLFVEDLEKEFPPKVLEFVAKHSGLSTKLISDLPIEWLHVDGAPKVSRSSLEVSGGSLHSTLPPVEAILPSDPRPLSASTGPDNP